MTWACRAHDCMREGTYVAHRLPYEKEIEGFAFGMGVKNVPNSHFGSAFVFALLFVMITIYCHVICRFDYDISDAYNCLL